MADYEQAVFISYAWGEDTHERETIVNQLDQSLQKRGLKIVRDKRDLGYKGSIRNFMQRIGEGDCVIVVISDKYLRSKNCMFELVEIAGNKQFVDRIFPIILSDAKIYDWRGQADYLDFWEKEKADLTERIRGLKELSNLTGLTEELNDYDRFRDEISKIMSTLKDMNSLSPDLLRNADFQQLYDKLVERRSSTWTKSKQLTPDASSFPKEVTSPKKEKKTIDPPKTKKRKSQPQIVQGGINIKGNVVIKNSKVAGRDNVEKKITNISYSFAPVYHAIEKSPNITPETQKAVEQSVKEIEQEVKKGSKARGTFIQQRLENILHMAPDIAQVVITTMQNPALGLSLAAKKVLNKFKAEKAKY